MYPVPSPASPASGGSVPSKPATIVTRDAGSTAIWVWPMIELPEVPGGGTNARAQTRRHSGSSFATAMATGPEIGAPPRSIGTSATYGIATYTLPAESTATFVDPAPEPAKAAGCCHATLQAGCATTGGPS